MTVDPQRHRLRLLGLREEGRQHRLGGDRGADLYALDKALELWPGRARPS